MGNWRKQRARFGTQNEESAKVVREEAIFRTLNRHAPINALDALMRAYRPEPLAFRLAQTAIALDSSAFLRLGAHVDVVDYLGTAHDAPLILPGQAVQEFWNSSLSLANSIATSIKKRFELLEQDVKKIDGSFQDYSDRFTALLSDFESTFGYAYDGLTVRRTHALFEVLQRKAIICHTSRNKFLDLAHHRKQTKTPPGFRDNGDGDFFVWLDLLQGLLVAKEREIDFSSVVLVTNDKKLDWSREGIAHPTLCAEVHAIVGVPFETWDVARLVKEVSSYGE